MAFAKSSIDAGSQFDAAMSQVAAVSGATGAEFDALRDKAMEMGSKTKFSASESAEAFNYMAMAGWKTEDMLNGIEGIMNLAAASGENLATTSDIVTDALTAFGMSAEESGHFADILAVASSNANTNVGMMGETFKYVAPVAGTMGYSAEDAAMAIGLMANSGIKASQAGTALRSIITRLSTDAGASSEKLGALGTLTEELGVQFYNADGSARDFGDVLIETREAWSGLTAEQQINYANTIAGQEALAGWNAIMNASESDVQKLTDAIENADGAALRMANTMQDNLAGDITIFKSALEGAQIVLSDQLTPSLREFVQFGSQSLSTLTTAFQEDGLTGAMQALGGIISEGITMIMEGLPQMIDAGMQLLGALGQGIIDNLPVITDAAVQVLISLITGIVNALPKLAEGAVQIVTTLATGIGDALPELIPAAVSAIAEFCLALTSPENISALMDGAIALIMGLAEGIHNALPQLVAALPEIIQNIVLALSENAPKLVETAVFLVGALIDGLIQSIPAIVEAIPQLVEALVNGFKSFISSFVGVGADIVNGILQGIVEGVAGLVQGAVDAVSSVVDSVKDFLGIHSPSKVFASIGENMALGLGEGWDSEFGDIKKDIENGMDFGTANVDFASSGLGQSSRTIAGGVMAAASSGGMTGDIVINLTADIDGAVLARKMYRYNQDEDFLRNAALSPA